MATLIKHKKAANKPTQSDKPQSCLFLIHGDDDFLVTQEAQQIIAQLTKSHHPISETNFSLETIDGMAANQNEAAAIFKKLFEALQSQSFFATEKVIWWRNTNLLSASPTASAAFTSDSLAALNKTLIQGLPKEISLVITATDLDGRKQIVKTLQKAGKVISFKADPYQQEANQAKALEFARETASQLGKKMNEEAALLLIEMTAGDSRTIHSELEKISSYVGNRFLIEEEDIRAVGSWRPGSVIWDLADAVNQRRLNDALNILEDLFFMGEAPIALLFTLISRMRLLLFLNALAEKKLIQAGTHYPTFKSQIDRLPASIQENLPQDKKLNPLANHPFVLWKASSGINHYSSLDLQKALVALLECNEKMVTSGSDSQHLLKEVLLKICAPS